LTVIIFLLAKLYSTWKLYNLPDSGVNNLETDANPVIHKVADPSAFWHVPINLSFSFGIQSTEYLERPSLRNSRDILRISGLLFTAGPISHSRALPEVPGFS
jgi:hypothetical protein